MDHTKVSAGGVRPRSAVTVTDQWHWGKHCNLQEVCHLHWKARLLPAQHAKHDLAAATRIVLAVLRYILCTG